MSLPSTPKSFFISLTLIMSDAGRIIPGGLNEEQSVIFKGFVSGHLPEATLGPAETSYYEQASAHLRDTLSRFDADLHTPQRAYDLMAGLSIGTVWVEGLMHHGLTAEQAGKEMRVSLASLLSAEPRSQDATL